MPFGRRRFEKIVVHGGRICAYFLPLDAVDAPAEFVEEEPLRLMCFAEGSPPREEALALKAFEQFARQKRATRASADAALARKGQLAITDPLDPTERATLDRFRKLVTKRALQRVGRTLADDDSSIADVHDLLDTSEEVLKLLDVYLPKGTHPAPAPERT